ncbi:LysM peptidoglycan-binding domain-containing protein [Pseudonocardiaceae bacterium YIM PH 21723]|nr:LysM peptidoglycan-binding domain-containing protein [Pseudonocardiaceae bacterium YIM PH 21723]
MGNTLRANQELRDDQNIVSDNGRFRLAMQPDGNLVLADLNSGSAIWSSKTNGSGKSAKMQGDGNFVVYADGDDAKWSSNTNGNDGAYVVVGNDGNVVVCKDDAGTLWETGTRVAGADQGGNGGGGGGAAIPEQQSYTVRPGDSLSAIAQQFYGDGNAYQKIADANGISNPDLIQPGQTLVIP